MHQGGATKTRPDRRDARGIAQLLRMGWFRPVHGKSPPAQEVRALLAGRQLLQGKLLDIERSIRGLLRGFGLKVGEVSKGRFAARIRELVTGQPMLERVIEPMLRAREALPSEHQVLHRASLDIARADATCRRLMTVPGVGALVAITFTSAVDDPARFSRSRMVGAQARLRPAPDVGRWHQLPVRPGGRRSPSVWQKEVASKQGRPVLLPEVPSPRRGTR